LNDTNTNPYKNGFNTILIGRTVYYYPSVTSTNDTAKKLAKAGETEGSVIITEIQSAGKGRLARTWLTPKGNLAMSVILKPPLEYLPQLIMIASLSVVYSIKLTCGIDAQIKWPNDILIHGKKVCGILIESEVKKNTVNYAIIGIGINVNFDPSSNPDIATLATSLSNETGNRVSLEDLYSAVLTEMEKLYFQVKTGMRIHDDWQNHMETLGRQITVKSGDTIEQGTAESVTENGSLLLRHHDGSLIEIMAGDVSVIKN
jgi:BirA family transcriptional regulator, biotin operon repressor / biotin---[acetyl-CoA-carboxylase] ligase